MGATESEREMLVQMLLGLQTGCDERYARQVLQKHDWNADQAAAALLDVVTAAEQAKKYGPMTRQDPNTDWVAPGALNAANPTPARPNSVIDLTGDDDEDTAKALAASMETHTTFGPSNRVDETQQWAMVPLVPSNAPPALSQEDQALNRALEASLSSSFVGAAQEPYEEPSDPTQRVRKHGWPTALRITNSTYCFAPVVLQCLLSLPKVLDRLLQYHIKFSGSSEQHAFAHQFQRLAGVFAHTSRAYVAIDDLLDIEGNPPSVNTQDPLAGSTRDFYSSLAHQLELVPHNEDDDWSEMSRIYIGVYWQPLLTATLRLLVFQGNTDGDVNESSSSYTSGFYMDIVVPSPFGNDMVSCLAHSFSKSEVYLTHLSECVTFVVRRQDDVALPGVEKEPLKYPASIYLDRFMQENSEQATELRNCQEGMQHEIQKLVTDRQKLSHWKNEDTLKDLRSSVHYFEHLADGSNPERKEGHELSKLKLLGIIKQIEANMKYLDVRIVELMTEAEELFDRPDLQQYDYDLRAVVMHDGLFGRNHIYSYTKDDKGVWWKIVDHQVSEVTEDMVLNDHTGLHLGAGPLLLFYCHASPIDPGLQNPRASCPRFVKDLVQQDNIAFLSEPEMASLYTGLGKLDDEQPLEGSVSDLTIPGLPAAEDMAP